MKKVLAVLLAAILCLSTAACSSSSGSNSPAPASTAPAQASEPAQSAAPAPVEVNWPDSAVQLIVSARSGGGTVLFK